MWNPLLPLLSSEGPLTLEASPASGSSGAGTEWKPWRNRCRKNSGVIILSTCKNKMQSMTFLTTAIYSLLFFFSSDIYLRAVTIGH